MLLTLVGGVERISEENQPIRGQVLTLTLTLTVTLTLTLT